MTTTREVLTKAKELLSVPGAWTKHASYRDADRNACSISRAVAYCVGGAVDVAAEQLKADPNSGCEALRAATLKCFGCGSYVSFNDSYETELPDVLSLLDQAIALVPEDELTH